MRKKIEVLSKANFSKYPNEALPKAIQLDDRKFPIADFKPLSSFEKKKTFTEKKKELLQIEERLAFEDFLPIKPVNLLPTNLPPIGDLPKNKKKKRSLKSETSMSPEYSDHSVNIFQENGNNAILLHQKKKKKIQKLNPIAKCHYPQCTKLCMLDKNGNMSDFCCPQHEILFKREMQFSPSQESNDNSSNHNSRNPSRTQAGPKETNNDVLELPKVQNTREKNVIKEKAKLIPEPVLGQDENQPIENSEGGDGKKSKKRKRKKKETPETNDPVLTQESKKENITQGVNQQNEVIITTKKEGKKIDPFLQTITKFSGAKNQISAVRESFEIKKRKLLNAIDDEESMQLEKDLLVDEYLGNLPARFK